MASFLNRLKNASSVTTSTANKDVAVKKKEKEELPPELTPLEKMLQNAGPLRDDGTDRFFGLENFGNTCYCNSVVQALFYQEAFRQHVVNYPSHSPSDTPNGVRPKVQVTIRPPIKKDDGQNPANRQKISAAEAMRRRQAASLPPLPGQPGVRPEDRPDAPEYKKKQAMMKGPVVELNQENPDAYGMTECTFTGLKDIFGALMESESLTGVLSPQRFLEIFKRDNEMFRNSMHQDAHEFYGLVLNDVIANVEANARRLQEKEEAASKNGLVQSVEHALDSLDAGSSSQATQGNGIATRPSGTYGTGWVHDIFEGVLTSETKCLTCETASQRDETFLDLSIDLEEHASVTSCLRKFSAEEMLCERNKFHCDHCGGLQEAEKRMKIKRLPKVMALHLKRFKYTEDYSRLQKLFHRVVYPYHLRMFNTTDDAEDPDRLYELYAVVVHIGGNAYHGHYVSVIKTKDRGWLLFDDEMVEPVDRHFVRNFFGDKPGTACAYVLFYQETTFEKVQAEMEAEGLEEVKMANEAANLAHENGQAAVNGNGNGNGIPLSKQTSQPVSPVEDRDAATVSLAHAQTAPGLVEVAKVKSAAVGPLPDPSTTSVSTTAASVAGGPTETTARSDPPKTKEERKREKKEQEAAEKARKLAEKERRKQEEKNLKESIQRRRELRLQETEALRQAIEESKKTAEEEDGARKMTEDAVKSPLSAAGPSLLTSPGGFLSRANRGSKSMMTKRSFGFLAKDKVKDKDRGEVPSGESGSNGSEGPGPGPGPGSQTEQKLKDRFSFSLGRKKSTNMLS
ncbi:cysteine proteinase [Sodiomyces alkalinus F11]|uniref:Ubiquitin carboxyl-terminal hydrolase n=1 Tax=Sodiomyces alkalinus (strain CBS 110278 / VKM F-3762 / F11) TaxID=1314773 RepID=A0A3N2PL87_SODAK|nr:cysteine proteinase [Sodiomyces alkalinus F11]ROT35287.1 cysteine proteinase [Sodiomyces alkalinus F11]